MKHLERISVTLLIFIFFCFTVSGQGIMKGLKDKAMQKIENKVEERANEKVDQEIDKQLDKAEDALFKNDNKSTTENKNEQRMTDLIRKMGVGGEPVPIEDSYTFNNLVQMHIESFDGSGKKTSDGEFITYLSSNSKSMAYEFISGDLADPGVGMIIVDAANKATIMLSEENSQKTGLVYGLGTFFESVESESMEDLDLSETPETFLANPNVEKTGRTKIIEGFKCEEYKYTDENSVSNFWITQDIKMNTKDFFSTLFKTSLYSHGMAWGYMMETTTVNRKNGEKSSMTVTRVDKNTNINFAMSDYQITNLGSFKAPEEK
jgi:hypothetical protein